MGFVKEFKEFAIKGNLIDLAVAVVIGAAFSKVVSAFVDGIVMPLIGLLTGSVDFSEQKYIISPANGDLPETAIQYGAFITRVIDFLIVAFVVFLVIKMINKFKRKNEAVEAAVAPIPTKEEILLTEIRDILKSKV